MSNEPFEYVDLEGLNAPLHVHSPDIVRPLLDPILAAWPKTYRDSNLTGVVPFASLGPAKKGRWFLRAPLAANPDALHNPVNAICDLVVEMSWERLRSRPELLCLHAAALTFGERLVIFPNARRAGKSMLTAALSHLDHHVFSDDFVPLSVDPETRVIRGMANGIAPRLRLPLPDNISASFEQWITGRIGPSNRQYGYLTGIELPSSGTTLPIGAMVLLERDPDLSGPATLEPVTREEAMSALVTQNFGRQVHAGAILTVTDALTRSVPVLRLRYNGVEEAAALLDGSADMQNLPAAKMPETDHLGAMPPAPLDDVEPLGEVLVDLDQMYSKLPDYTEIETETALYLADGIGVAIHRLNPVSTLIWKLLDEELTGTEMVAVMQDLYPDIAIDRLQTDVASALKFLRQRRLITPNTAG